MSNWYEFSSARLESVTVRADDEKQARARAMAKLWGVPRLPLFPNLGAGLVLTRTRRHGAVAETPDGVSKARETET